MTNHLSQGFAGRLTVVLLGLAVALGAASSAQAYTSDGGGVSQGLRTYPGAMPLPFPVPAQMQPLPQPFPRPSYERPRY